MSDCLQAIKKFDPTKNVRFYAYAAWWARAYILRYLLNTYRLIKIGTTQDQRKLFYNLKKEKAKLEREGFAPDSKLLGRSPECPRARRHRNGPAAGKLGIVARSTDRPGT